MIETKVFSLDLNTYSRIYRSEQSQSMKKSVFIFLLVLMFISGISIYGYMNTGTLDILISWVPLIIMYCLFFVFLYWALPVWMYKNKENRYSFTNRIYRFGEEKLVVESDEGVVAEIPYKVIVKNNTGKYYFALWESSLTAYMIPFEAFKSEEDIQSTKRILAAKRV